ncbi:MAG: RHS repeat-associated core domain-containing protein [Fimbriimonadaceae bacterium]
MTTFPHSGLKNAGAQTDAPASGDPSASATRGYDAFGSPTAASGSWQGPFAYAGQFGYQTESTGLHLLGHRYYDASLGRFLTRDPVGDGSNWYAYCKNDPLSRVDPAGLNWKRPGVLTAPTRIRMVFVPPGYSNDAGLFPVGHAWIEIEDPDGTVYLYDHGPGGNVGAVPLAPDLYVDGVYYREMLVPRPRYLPKNRSFYYGVIVNNCVTFTRVVWRENGGDGPNPWSYIRFMGPGPFGVSKLLGKDTVPGLYDDYDGWKRR